jgi:hypothetical protein
LYGPAIFAPPGYLTQFAARVLFPEISVHRFDLARREELNPLDESIDRYLGSCERPQGLFEAAACICGSLSTMLLR